MCFRIVVRKLTILYYSILNMFFNKNYIIDITGTVLTPGNSGINCRGNGEHFDWLGNPIEACCDECDYLLCCIESYPSNACQNCTDQMYPRSINTNSQKIHLPPKASKPLDISPKRWYHTL